MKIARAVATSDAPTRWGYLAFALTMLHLVQRARNKDVVKENMVSFFAALLPTELSHKFLALNAGVVVWLQRSKTPVLAGWIGSLAGFVQCIVMLRLAQMYRSNVRAKHAIRDAMVTQSDIAPTALQHIGDLSLRNWLSVLLPLPQPMALALSYPGVTNVGCVVYAHVGSCSTTKLRMDIFRHASHCKPNAPILLYIHGGGWVVGDRKNPPRPLIHQVASLGWVVCVIDYRLSPKVAFPSHLIDAKRAVAYLREHAHEQLQADPTFIVVAGESAGGHLASLMALTSGDKTLQPGFEDVDTSVRGCIDTYGVHDFRDRNGIYFYKDKGYSFVRFLELVVMQKKLKDASDAFDAASPLSWVEHATQLPSVDLLDDDASSTASSSRLSIGGAALEVIPPFLVSHGTHDTLVPFEDSAVFFESLQRYRESMRQRGGSVPATLGGVDDVFLEIPDAHHAFNYLVSPRALAYGEAVCAFLDNLYRKTKHLPLSSSATVGVPIAEIETADAQDSENVLTRISHSVGAPATTVSRL